MDFLIVKKIIDLGFKVYMRDDKDTWLIYTDGTNIGYLQDDRGMGLSISTVHKPNHTTGTGFLAIKGLGTVALSDLKVGFIICPVWASQTDRESVKKYKDIYEFLNANPFNKQYREIAN